VRRELGSEGEGMSLLEWLAFTFIVPLASIAFFTLAFLRPWSLEDP
jgi:hypothetical protein